MNFVAHLWNWITKNLLGLLGNAPNAEKKLTLSITVPIQKTGYRKVFDRKSFLDWAKEYALIVEVDYAIPHLITITNAAHESGNGNSKLTTECCNFFGMTASDDWINKGKAFKNYPTTEFHSLPPEKIKWWNRPGDILSKEPDGKGGSILKVQVPFRSYEKALDSFQDWAYKIKTKYPKAYDYALKGDAALFYKHVQEGGYATDTNYAYKLLDLYHEFRKLEQEVTTNG